MTVGQLRHFLAPYPDDMEIVETRCSDVCPMDLTSWQVITALRQDWDSGRPPTSYSADAWMRVLRTDEEKRVYRDHAKDYVHFDGN